ncbi:MAG: non-homologous end-joining DNA ligase [Gammaproteobacteria bacterium]|jgi:bifunctional non-homologous end joining protein LigD|nr:non-homologous end-joining DNA ligase [Gammaproteobacteria bacterium]
MSASRAEEQPLTLSGVRVTNPGRVVYPPQGVTKGEIAAYLERIADRMLPHVAGRPLSLVRCPRGQPHACFFQRHLAHGMPPGLHGFGIPGKDRKPYLYIEDRAGLIGTAQTGALELHTWGARIDDIEHPDRMIFDLDPDRGVPFTAVRETAFLVREILSSARLDSFVMLTGGKGLHVIVPLSGHSSWNEVRDFSRGIAAAIAADEPGRYTIKASKARRHNRIFIDWMRNLRGGTAVAPYSMRARPRCPIAVPLRWDELPRIMSAARYDIGNIDRRLAALRKDPWQGMFELDQDLPPNIGALLARWNQT